MEVPETFKYFKNLKILLNKRITLFSIKISQNDDYLNLKPLIIPISHIIRYSTPEMNKKQHGGGHKKHITETYKVKGYETRVFTSAEEFLKHAEGDDGIKLVKNEFPSCKGLLVMDGSLSAKGPVEDRIYSDFPFYRNNLRRGLTLGKFGGAVYWLRKGLRKFFDVNLPALKGEAKGDN